MNTDDSPRTTTSRWFVLVGATVAVIAAVVASLLAPSSGRAAVLLPAGAALGLGAVVVAVTRFELFVWLVVLARASMDTLALGSSTLDASGAISVLFVGASCLWLVAQRDDVDSTSSTGRLVRPIAALFACALVSVLFSDHTSESLLEVIRFGTLVVIVAVLGRLIRDERSARYILVAALGSTIVPLLFGARQLSSGGVYQTAEGLDRIRGTFLHSNPFATYLFLMVTLIVSVYPHMGRRWKLALLPLGLACGGMLIATYSRGAWIAVVLALIVVGLLQDRRILWVLGASLIVVLLTVPSVAIRLSDLTESQKETGAPGNSLIWRFQYWRQVLALQDNPVLGIGFKEVELTEAASKAPHNDPIRVFVETGLLGLAAYLWLFITLGLEVRSSLRRAPPGLPRGLAVAFAASLSGIVALSLTANVITQLVILWYFMTIVALALGATRVDTRQPVPASA